MMQRWPLWKNLILAMVFLLFTNSAFAIKDIVTLTIINQSDETICYVAIVTTGTAAENVTNDMFYSTVIKPDEQHEYEIESGFYTVGLFDCNQKSLSIWRDTDLSQPITLTYPDPIQDRRDKAVDLNNRGFQAYNQGLYTEALDFYQQALVIMREVGDRNGEGTTLNNVGGVYHSQGQYAQALDFYQRALVIMQEVGDRNGEGTTLSNIGGVYHSQGQYAQALDFYEQSLVIMQEVGDRKGEGTTLSNIGGVYHSQGQYAQALVVYQQALTIRQEVVDRKGEGTTLGKIGGVYADQGQYAQALDMYQQALTIIREVGDRAGEGATLNNIGIVYHHQGQYAQALNIYQQALAIKGEIGDRAGEGATLNNIGMVYAYQGQYAQALDVFQQVFVIVHEVGDRAGEGTTLNNIGGVYYSQGQYAQALDFYQRALVIVHEVGNRPREGETLNNIGGVYHSQGQYTQALDFYQQALTIIREVGDRNGEGATLTNIGTVYADQGRYAQALDVYQQALIIQREIENRADEGVTLSSIGLIYTNQGQSEKAIDFYQQAVDIQESLLQSAVLDESITSLAEGNVGLYARLTILLIQQGDLPAALEYAERGRSILSRNELRNQPIDYRANQQDQTLLQEEETLRLAVLDAQNRVNSLNKDLNVTEHAKQDAQAALEKAQDTYNRHLERMQLQGGFLSRQLALDVASLDDIQAALPEDTALLVYGVSFAGSYALLVTAGDLQGFTLRVSDAQINAAVKTFATDRKTNTSVLSDLYQLIFAPIADNIPTSTKRLIISADGALNYVPFAALQVSDDSYLIDHYAISMIPSGTTLVLLKDRQTAPSTQPILALAQPSAPPLPRLANARTEASEIADLFDVEANINATEADLRANVAGSGILHISAHAELNLFAPLYSVIHLAASDEYDGRLEVREIYELDLSATELVILSGCDTGIGGDGEDFGLINRAFFGAGTQKVVSSLWSVDDAATAELLTAFMKERLSGTYSNDADALQAAMLKTRETYPNPYYWASFVLAGLPD